MARPRTRWKVRQWSRWKPGPAIAVTVVVVAAAVLFAALTVNP